MDRNELQKCIESRWFRRAVVFNLKPRSARYRRSESDFFAGAISAIDAIFPNERPDVMSEMVPTIWVINGLSGRPIIDYESIVAAKKAEREEA